MSSISFGVRQNWVWILALRRLTVWHLRSLSLSFLVFKLGRNSATSRWGLLWKFNEIIYVKHLAQHRNEALPLLQRCDWPQWWYFLLAPNFTYGWRKCKRGPGHTPNPDLRSWSVAVWDFELTTYVFFWEFFGFRSYIQVFNPFWLIFVYGLVFSTLFIEVTILSSLYIYSSFVNWGQWFTLWR